ncbi:MAG: S-adenosylmethionine:tRNA ribosyltransferase-isomerase [Tannerella sp.]|jgi:S-adenosylmethionine:tRNA ribosyltransferase-isomerase|nr:S-adenosylmethionine:tRNA ribosyltransferase-isomerase [Tannerella sp.]
MMINPQQIHIADYDYPLPDERIAKYPLSRRDTSKLLVYRQGDISETVFNQLPDLLPEKSLLVFNNTRVIQARLLFRKETGAQIEIFCLEPIEPHDYTLVFQQTRQCTWKCLVGNLKRWKNGTLQQSFPFGNESVVLTAERKAPCEDSFLITFSWDHPACTFADILDAAGVLPIPPYLHRETEQTDLQTYQTVYSKIKGSVAAPTAGLHFTPEVLAAIDAKGIRREEITLHVGAGTFKPVKTETIGEHPMHTEYFAVQRQTVSLLLESLGHLIAVGTTSVRTLESLYYIGATLSRRPDATAEELTVRQWAPYEPDAPRITPAEALQHILDYMDRQQTDRIITATQILIAPGYTFQIVRGMITNFHQPQSTLLLLVSAFVKGDWKRIYDYAMARNFRFLSYGDSSLLLQNPFVPGLMMQ